MTSFSAYKPLQILLDQLENYITVRQFLPQKKVDVICCVLAKMFINVRKINVNVTSSTFI